MGSSTFKWLNFVLMIPFALWRGYVLSIIWGWHIVPVFGLPAISVATGWGISVIVGFLTYQLPLDFKQSDELDYAVFGISIVLPVIVLFSAWLATFFL